MGKASASPISKLRLTERVSQMSAGAEDGKRGTFREKEESSKRWPGVTFHLLEVIGLPVFWEAGHVWKRWWGGRRLEAGGTCWWAAVADMQRRPRQTAGKQPSRDPEAHSARAHPAEASVVTCCLELLCQNDRASGVPRPVSFTPSLNFRKPCGGPPPSPESRVPVHQSHWASPQIYTASSTFSSRALEGVTSSLEMPTYQMPTPLRRFP